MRRVAGAVGRAAFAVALAGFGVLCLGFVDIVHNLQPLDLFVSRSAAVYVPVAVLTGLIMLTASAAVATGVRTHALMLGLAGFFAAWIVTLQVPSALVFPTLLRSPWWVRTFEVLALAGGALVLAGLTVHPARRGSIRWGGTLYGLSLPVFGVLHVIYAQNVASLVPAFYPWPLFWAYLTGAGKIAAGAAIVTGILPRTAALLAGIQFGVYVLTLHIPLAVTTYMPQLASGDGAALQAARAGLTSLFVAIGMWGAAWIVAGGFGDRTVPDGQRKGSSLQNTRQGGRR